MRLPLILLALVAFLSAPASADHIHAETYHNEGASRSGITVSSTVEGCNLVYFWFEYYDRDGDLRPDSIPPGGPAPRLDYSVGCL